MRHARRLVYQLAEVLVTREMLGGILERIGRRVGPIVLKKQAEVENMANPEDLGRFITRFSPPEDFADFWQEFIAELEAIPLKPGTIPVLLRSNEAVSGYRAIYRRFNGLEIAAWNCVPTAGDGPFPATPKPFT